MATPTNKASNGLILILVLFLINIPLIAQELTDKEIGFDREKAKKELYENNPFINKKFLDNRLEELRENAVIKYKFGQREWLKRQLDITKANITKAQNNDTEELQTQNNYAQRFAGCDVGTFDEEYANPLASGWTLFYNISPYAYSNNNLQSSSTTTGTQLINDGQTRFWAADTFSDNYMTDSNVGSTTNIGSRYLRLGNSNTGTRREMIRRTFTLNSEDDFIFYRFAIVLQDPSHSNPPFFSVRMFVNDTLIECSEVMYVSPTSGSSTPGFTSTSIDPTVYVRPWNSNVIKPSDFGAQLNDEITIEVAVSDCSQGGHFGYGYFDIECIDDQQVILSADQACIGDRLSFSPGIELSQKGFFWELESPSGTPIGQPITSNSFNYAFNQPGTYAVKLNVPYFTTTSNCSTFSTFTKFITVDECQASCEDCATFNPTPGEKYIISGWVKEKTMNDEDIQVMSYTKPLIRVYYTDLAQNIIGNEEFSTAGEIIDGWQRIYGEFTLPAAIDDLHIELDGGGSKNVTYFDDIRVFPFNGSMKSFVYDQATQRLMAELDENNYATFYEYDKEGGLVRVKKETKAGVKTIQETRSGISKKELNGN